MKKMVVWTLAVVGCWCCLWEAASLTRGFVRRAAPYAHQLIDDVRALRRKADDKAKKKPRRRYTVHQRLEMHGPAARKKLRAKFKRADVPYPPKKLTFVGLKHERQLQIYAPDAKGQPTLVARYPILGASGTLGPKLREGDRQVPEGIYKIDFLNPNSTNHLSMRVTYPSAADRAQARREGRKGLGGEIYIHGKMTSAGCLAMGDRAIEEIWVLAADAHISNIDVIISPVDTRRRKIPAQHLKRQPKWVKDRYERIATSLKAL